MEKLFVIQDIETWCPSIRSKATNQSRPKRAFCVSSVTVASLNLSPDALMAQLKTFGFIFEQIRARDLRVYSASHNSRLSYYRDRYGLETDLMIVMTGGSMAYTRPYGIKVIPLACLKD